MQNILNQLIEHTAAALDNEDLSSEQTDELQASLSSLVLARTALIKRELRQQSNVPAQVVVVGPTQVGKSSLVNWLLGTDVAGASARASHTVHCSGYATGLGDELERADTWAEVIFSGMSRREARHLDRQFTGEYAIETVDTATPLPPCIIWDTPDFDSHLSFRYRLAVLQAAALADLVVFVVSPEKYADRSVWTMLDQLHALGQRVVLAMNKTPAEVRTELGESMRDKYVSRIDRDVPEIGFVDVFAHVEDGSQSADIGKLRELVNVTLTSDVADRADKLPGFMRAHWPAWTGSATLERESTRQWASMVQQACESFKRDYQQEYLDHARKDETLQLALAELLVLLEVPGIAQPLTRLRGIVTWPVRQLMSQVESRRDDLDARDKDVSEESRLLTQMGDQVVNTLATSLVSKVAGDSQPDWWRAVSQRFGDERDGIQSDYQAAIDRYQQALQGEIQQVARGLYQQLQQQPATLNSLRAARVSADAAAVVLAVKSGGLGLADLVIAPAMLSLTTMLTEGALGKYMEKIQADLRAHQLSQVNEMMQNQLQQPLEALAQQSSSVWAGIDHEALAEARDKLERDHV
jgi:ethanolamine utilization protein EutP (predicted NTPase)/GTPase SAR1 family protein